MHFKILWKDTCKEFRKEEAHELFEGMMDKLFAGPCQACRNGGWCSEYQVCNALLNGQGVEVP